MLAQQQQHIEQSAAQPTSATDCNERVSPDERDNELRAQQRGPAAAACAEVAQIMLPESEASIFKQPSSLEGSEEGKCEENNEEFEMIRQTGDTTAAGEQKRGRRPRRRPGQVDEFHRSYDKISTNNDDQDNNKLEARGIETRLLVRRREAGALIGKRGDNIKRLRQLHQGSVFNIPDTGNGPERIVCIDTRSLDLLDPVLVDVLHLFQEKQNSNWAHQPIRPTASQTTPSEQQRRTPPPPPPSGYQKHSRGGTTTAPSDVIEVKLLVNASHAGSLIGMGGEAIKKLRNDSKAAIKIYEMCCPLSSERVCAIKAKPPVVVSTIKMIHELLLQTPIKGPHKPYDALNHDEILAEKYGGFSSDDDPFSSSNAPLRSRSPNRLLSPSPLPLAYSTSPLELLQQQLQHPQTSDPTALMLQGHAVRLLAAAAAATAAAAANTGDHQHLEPPSYLMRGAPLTSRSSGYSHFNRPRATADPLDRHSQEAATASMMAALAAEKYHSIVRAGQQALAAGRFHPYHASLGGAHPQMLHARQQQQPARHRRDGGGVGGHAQGEIPPACAYYSSRSPTTGETAASRGSSSSSTSSFNDSAAGGAK